MDMQEALEEAGFVKEDYELAAALQRYFRNGGTRERAHRLVDAAADKVPGKGQHIAAKGGQANPAQPRQPDGGEAGQMATAESGHSYVARPPSADADGGGQSVGAENGHKMTASPVRSQPRRTPNSVAGARKNLEHLGWLGRARIPHGPKMAEIRIGDLPGMYRRMMREGGLCAHRAVTLKTIEHECKKLGVVSPDQLWVDVLPEETIKSILYKTNPDVLKTMAAGWLEGFNRSAIGVVNDDQ